MPNVKFIQIFVFNLVESKVDTNTQEKLNYRKPMNFVKIPRILIWNYFRFNQVFMYKQINKTKNIDYGKKNILVAFKKLLFIEHKNNIYIILWN